jgi:hypothetical protein
VLLFNINSLTEKEYNSMTITTIDDSIMKIEVERVNPISNDSIKDIFSTLKIHDSDMSVILDIILKLIMELEDQCKKTLFTLKILKFYGINNTDILTTRHRNVVESGVVVKVPFLKNKQKEMLNILLNQLDVEVF